MIFLKRNVDEVKINGFNEWIATKLKSNMDLQYILDMYSCANYVSQYVNKTKRGMSVLVKEIQEIQKDRSEIDFTEALKTICLRMLNIAEISTQEGAWVLLL